MMTHKISKKRSLLSGLLSAILISGLFLVFACESEPQAFVNPETAFVMNGQLVQPQEILSDSPGESENIVRVEIDGQEHYLKPEISDEHNTSIIPIEEAKKRFKNLSFSAETQKVVLIEESLILEGDEENEEVFMVVEKMPQYPGGKSSLFTYLSKNIKYPKFAQENGIQGKVFCQFIVGKEGIIKDVKIVRGVDPYLDAEAVRIIKSMPAWEAGQQRGKDVNVQFMLPINFVLSGAGPTVVLGDFVVNNRTMKVNTRIYKDQKTQKRVISGHLVDEDGQALPGASVVSINPEARFSNGTISDIQGNFSLELNDQATKVVISFVGNESLTVDLAQSALNAEASK